jgi:small-conductance mechanosensitive channel
MQQFFNYVSGIMEFMMERRIIGALIIMALFAIGAKLVAIFLHRILKYIGTRSNISVHDSLTGIMHRPAWIIILLVGAWMAVEWLHPGPRTAFILTAVLNTALILTIGWSLNRLMQGICHLWWTSQRQGKELIHFYENIGRVLVLIVGVALLLIVWKINITPLLASAGIAGIAVALAAKDTLANFFGGISIFLDKPFSNGDYIILDSGERGEVLEVGVRSTLIRTRDDEQVSIPNAIIANTKIINESAPEPRYRVRIQVGVAYGTDLGEVETALLEVARSNSSISQDPVPRARFRVFGNSALQFELLCWAKKPADRGRVIHELNSAVYRKFQQKNITIPFPQQDIYLHSLSSNASGLSDPKVESKG